MNLSVRSPADRPPDDAPALNGGADGLVPPYDRIRRQLEEGEIVPFLGAGASLPFEPIDKYLRESSQRPPTGSELAELLAQDSQYPGDPSDLALIAQFYEYVQVDQRAA